MAALVTNRGKFKMLGWSFRGTTRPTNFYLIAFTAATAPTVDTNVVSDHTEIAAGNGYTTGGYQLTPNSTDFDVHTEDDGANTGYIEIKDVVWTASGGAIPASGNPARYFALTDDNVTVSAREVYASFDDGATHTASSGQTLTVPGCRITGA
jgi:hypothetical protein